MGKLVIEDRPPVPAAKPSAPPPQLYRRPLKLVGMALVPKGFVTVTAELDVNGKLVSLKQGQPQTFREYIAAECKRILGALVLQ